MAEMMRDYHAKIQTNEQEPDAEARTQAVVEVLNRVTIQTPEECQEVLGARLAYDDVANALFLSANGKAPGLDGIPYEVYKAINGRFKDDRAHDQPAFDIVGALLAVFNDIEEHG
ncbi:hypothetical protein EV360DRAFT_19277, partial [Lentinula raphanica]